MYTNTAKKTISVFAVLNLIINGLPSKLREAETTIFEHSAYVLNLIINGLPSKPLPKG